MASLRRVFSKLLSGLNKFYYTAELTPSFGDFAAPPRGRKTSPHVPTGTRKQMEGFTFRSLWDLGAKL